MKQTLRTLFKTYGEVLDVVAHRNLRMRGQAFVSFADVNSARRAARERAPGAAAPGLPGSRTSTARGRFGSRRRKPLRSNIVSWCATLEVDGELRRECGSG